MVSTPIEMMNTSAPHNKSCVPPPPKKKKCVQGLM